MLQKPYIVVLNSTNPSRLAHLRKLYQLQYQYEFLLVADKRGDIGWQSKFVPNAVAVDMVALDQDFEKLLDRIGKRPDGIITLSEFCVPLQIKLCSHFGLPGPNEKSAVIGRNKNEMRHFLRSIDLPVPRFLEIRRTSLEKVKDFEYPVIVKPVAGGGSTMVQLCLTFEEVVKAFNRYEKKALQSYGEVSLNQSEASLMIEEVIGGEVLFPTSLPYHVGEISVESIHFEGKTKVLAIHDKPLPANGPFFEEYLWSTPTRMSIDLVQQATDYVDRIHRETGSYVLHTEFRTFRDRLVPLEFGVRMGGACIYQTVLYSTGNDFIEVLIALAQGKSPLLKDQSAIPTIAHTLWAEEPGVIQKIAGETELTRTPLYMEHQLYDDIGDTAKRAPYSSRANGHVIYRSEQGFASIEQALLESLACFKITTQPKEASI